MSRDSRTPLDLGPIVARYRTGTYAIPVDVAVRDCRHMLVEIEELRGALGRVLDLTTWDDGEQREDMDVVEILDALDGEVVL